MKEDIFDKLENAEESEIEYIAENFPDINKSDMKKIFETSERKFKNKTERNEVEVRGVERYRKPVWSRFAVAAASLVIAAGGIGIGGHILSERKEPVAEIEEESEITENESIEEISLNQFFSEMAEDRVRIMTTAFAPCLVELSDDSKQILADIMVNAEQTEDISEFPDGEFVSVFVYNDGSPYMMYYMHNGIVRYFDTYESRTYHISEEQETAAFNIFNAQYSPHEYISYHEKGDTRNDVWAEPEVTDYAKLEMHEMITAVDDISEYLTSVELYSRPQVDRQLYIDKMNSSDDLNTLELKSYVYHIMLNSTNYFDTVSGTIYSEFPVEEYVYFQSDLLEQYSWEEDVCGDESVVHYAYDGNRYDVCEKEKKYSQNVIGIFDAIVAPPDNYRYCIDETGTVCSFTHQDWSNLSLARMAVDPQEIAMSRLGNFENWSISGMVNEKTVCIEGSFKDNTFTMLTDLQTGILLKYEELNAIGEKVDYFVVEELTVDQPVERREFDSTGYELQYMMP